jgi:hypothetical protein
LQKGAAGWVLLAGLGVAYVISGEIGVGNSGSPRAGGLLIATVLTAIIYTAVVYSLAELSAAIPVAGAGYGFARRAMGVWGGFLTGTAIVIEVAIAPAAIATFIGGYVESLIGFGGPVIYLLFNAVFVGMLLYGTGEALRIMFIMDYSLLRTARIEPLLRRIRNSMAASGLAVENAKGECNFGQHEINFRFDRALATADGHAIYKNGAKEIAAQEGCSISFMPKFDEREGNSCHIHLSLRGEDGTPVFVDGHGTSETFRNFERL